jgi:hypothetical protein
LIVNETSIERATGHRSVEPTSGERAMRLAWGVLLVPVNVAVSLWGTLWLISWI